MDGILAEKALVLNRNWIPIRFATVRDAISMVYKGAARIVRPDTYEVFDFRSWAELVASPHEPQIRTVTLKLRVPEVVVLEMFDELPIRGIVFSRRNIFRRDRNQCQYCGARPGTKELTIDHVIPKAVGGNSTWENCILCCIECNKRKGGKTPVQVGMKLRRKPYKPKWNARIAIPVSKRKESWEKFISRAYWEVELEHDE